MTRKEANLELLEILRTQIEQYPDLRFTQLLINTGIIEADHEGVIRDEFYLESSELLDRVKSYLKVNNNPLLKKILENVDD